MLMSKTLTRQSTLYVLVGMFVYLIDLATFTIMVVIWPESYLIGNIFAKIIGAIVGFILHKHITFSWEQHYNTAYQFLAYFSLLFTNICVGTFLIYIALDIYSFPIIPSRISIDVLIIIFSFIFSRQLIFRRMHND